MEEAWKKGPAEPAFRAKDVVKACDIPHGTLNYYAMSGLLRRLSQPETDAGRARQFTFFDVLALAVARRLITRLAYDARDAIDVGLSAASNANAAGYSNVGKMVFPSNDEFFDISLDLDGLITLVRRRLGIAAGQENHPPGRGADDAAQASRPKKARAKAKKKVRA
jgi:hypothetical protein